MNAALLTLLVVATGAAAWSAASIGEVAGGPAPAASVQARAGTATPSAALGCLGAPRGRIVLRAPQVDPTGMAGTDHARIETALVAEWRQRMTAAGVPGDLLDRAARMPNRVYELSNHDMDRVGCIAA